MKYQVQLDVYEGPLDLLLRSVANEEIPAGEVSVCTIIDQFIEYYMRIAFSDLDEGSRFLVLAATLLAIKARLLLPRREEEKEEDESELLEQDDEEGILETHLDEYLAFKDAATTLEDRAREWMMVYRRLPTEVKLPEQSGTRDDISRLVEAFQGIMERISKLPEPYRVESVSYDLDTVMSDLLERIKSHAQGIYFSEFFPVTSGRERVIITFLAVLELVYEGKVAVKEDRAKEEILLIFRGSV